MSIRVATILGTGRPGNYTSKALALVEDELSQRGAGVVRLDPASYTLALPGRGEGDSKKLQEAVTGADGIVFSTPEYHGSMAAEAKLLIENLGFPSVLAGKPIVLLGVAAGAIGAIKSLEQLRSVLSHTGALVLPGPVSVAGVRRVFSEDGQSQDPAVEKRIRGLADVLLEYVESKVCPKRALEAEVRERGASS